MRVQGVIVFLMAFAVLGTACENRGKRTPIRRDVGNESIKVEGKSILARNAFAADGCLNLEVFKKFLSKQENNLITIYNNDLDVGTYQWLDNEAPRTFIPLIPTDEFKVAKAKLLLCDSSRPTLIVQKASKFLASKLVNELLGEAQTKCETITAEGKILKIENKLASRLTVKSEDNQEVREYTVKGGDQMEIKIYRDGDTGIVNLGWLKKSYVIAWGPEQDSLVITRGFGTFLKESVNTPAEFDLRVAPATSNGNQTGAGPHSGRRKRLGYASQRKVQSRDAIGLSATLFGYVIDQVAAGELKNSCN